MNRACIFQQYLFQFQSVFERFADPFSYLVEAMGERIERYDLQSIDIRLTVFQICSFDRGTQHLGDQTDSRFVILEFDEFAFERDRQFVDDWSIDQFGFRVSHPGFGQLV